MSDLEQILLCITTSGVTAAIIVLLIKKIIERYIEHIFHEKEVMRDSLMEMKRSAGEAFFNKELTVYPEVAEVVYRSRNTARDCVSEETRNRTVLHEFSACRVHLTENLYKYRIFFPEGIFRKLHRFKNEIQEFGVLLDETTRSVGVEDSPVDTTIQELAKKQLKEKYDVINKIFKSLISEIEELIRTKAKI